MLLDIREDPDLRRRPHNRVFRSHRQKTHGITKALRHAVGPRLKLIARPFKSVVSMSELPGREISEFDVVFRVGRRQDHSAWSSELEQHALKSSKARRV